MKKYLKTIALVLVTASATFFITLLAFRLYYGINDELFRELHKYVRARADISAHYVGEYDEAALTDASLAAAVAALSDPWSYYMTAEEYAAYAQADSNTHEGIGIQFLRTEDTNDMEIVSVNAGSPAEEAGLLPGERILAIDGVPVNTLTETEIGKQILDAIGTVLSLTVADSGGEIRETSIVPGAYEISPVSYSLLEDGIGYIAVSNFRSRSAEEGIAAIENLIEQGAKALIFDVRNNPGGKVSEMLSLLDRLLPEGDIFISADRNGNEKVETSDAECLTLPIAVLVNKNSYSAAEYFAAILQEYGWAQVIGEQTTGKGRSQITLPLPGESAIHISAKRYYTPGGTDLSEIGGLLPDYIVSDPDGQLEAALEFLK